MASMSAKVPSAPPADLGRSARNGYEAFITITNKPGMSWADKQELLSNIWKNSTQADRQQISSQFPEAEEQYGARRSRRSSRKTKKTKRSHKKTYKRRY